MSWLVGHSAWMEYVMGHNMKFNSTYIPDEALNYMYCIHQLSHTAQKAASTLHQGVYCSVMCKKTQKSGYVTFS